MDVRKRQFNRAVLVSVRPKLCSERIEVSVSEDEIVFVEDQQSICRHTSDPQVHAGIVSEEVVILGNELQDFGK